MPIKGGESTSRAVIYGADKLLIIRLGVSEKPARRECKSIFEIKMNLMAGEILIN